jgi:septal ring-binding cell division protein DamX
MRENIRLKQQPFGLSLGVKQVGAVLVAALLIMGTVFALGLSLGRRSGAGPEQPLAAPRDALARLDDPLPVKEEPPLELKAHQALTDSRSIEKTMPVPAVNVARAPPAPAAHAGEAEIVMPPAIAAPVPPSVKAGDAPSDTPQASAPTLPPPIAPMGSAAAHPAAASPPARAAAREGKPEIGEAPRPALRAKPKPKGTGSYTIQVASTQHKADAERLAKRLAARRPRIVAADLPGKGRWYRVQVGSFETRESARLALLSMSGVHGIVTPARTAR